MEPFFKNQNKKNLIEYFYDEFNSMGYSFQNISNPEHIGAKQVIKIFPKGKESNFISVIPWIRGISTGQQGLIEQLADYPRLNITKDVRKKPEEERISSMMSLCKIYNLYFLVVLPRPFGKDQFWLERYTKIPEDKWKLTYRRDRNDLDRIHLPVYDNYDFMSLDKLKVKLDKILK